jgi:hypothetical protein
MTEMQPDHEKFVDVRVISLPVGGILEVSLTAEICRKIREQFNLSDDQQIENDHVRMFVWGACKTAFDKAEQEMRQDGRWKDD